jgi:signal transduction histidine kinase
MTIRLRLTIFYSFILGGVLLVFSGMVYSLVGVALMDQIDQTLIQSAHQLIDQLKVDSYGQINSRSIMQFESNENLIFQIWGQDRELQFSRPIRFTTSLDESGKFSLEPMLNTVQLSNGHFRVLSVPIVADRGTVGIVQFALSLNMVDLARQTLAILLIIFSLFSVFLAGIAAWVFTGHVLKPIRVMTNVATQIVNADDLQRRIPVAGVGDDEVGKLIFAFNNTLSRLESDFNNQRQFMADISHDLRTPLTVIKGNVGLMRRMKEMDEESMSSIDMEVDRLVRLVSDLLLHFKMESGTMPLQLEVISLDELLLDVVNQIHVMSDQRAKMIVEDIDQVKILGDTDRLKRVFINLLDNSVKYTPKNGEVRIRLRKNKGEAIVEIEDTGPGISSDDIQHIFNRFYRGEKSRKRSKDTGFGLGLSIAYYIVQAHNGEISVRNKEHESGAIFTVCLPLQE